MRTGDSCERTAAYRSGCPCGARIAITLGTKAPECPICMRACNWILGRVALKSRVHTRSFETRRQDPRV